MTPEVFLAGTVLWMVYDTVSSPGDDAGEDGGGGAGKEGKGKCGDPGITAGAGILPGLSMIGAVACGVGRVIQDMLQGAAGGWMVVQQQQQQEGGGSR